MTFSGKINKRSQVYSFWRMGNQKGGFFRGVPFYLNLKTADYETKELTDFQVKILNQFKDVVILELISNPVPAEITIEPIPIVEEIPEKKSAGRPRKTIVTRKVRG